MAAGARRSVAAALGILARRSATPGGLNTRVVHMATGATGAGALGAGAAAAGTSGGEGVGCQEAKLPRKPAASTSGNCPTSGVRYYAARSQDAAKSASRHAVAEQLHQFVVIDGMLGTDGGARCATFCAERLIRLAAHSFSEQVRLSPLQGFVSPQGVPLRESEAAASSWAEALKTTFTRCDEWAIAQDVDGACGALMCVVARSGTYVASIGLGRAVVGTETDGGMTVLCDEVSSPHTPESEFEADRLGSSLERFPEGRPTRLLGAALEKQTEPLLWGMPDVVRLDHEDLRRFVVLASPNVWAQGPRQPLHWAIQAYRSGRNPADELIARSKGDVVAMVIVLPPGLGAEEDPIMPPHDEFAWPRAGESFQELRGARFDLTDWVDEDKKDVPLPAELFLTEKLASREATGDEAPISRSLSSLPTNSLRSREASGVYPGGNATILSDEHTVIAACRAAGIGPRYDDLRRMSLGRDVHVERCDDKDGTVLCAVEGVGSVWFPTAAFASKESPLGSAREEENLTEEQRRVRALEEELKVGKETIAMGMHTMREQKARLEELQALKREEMHMFKETRHEAVELTRENTERRVRFKYNQERLEQLIDERDEYFERVKSLVAENKRLEMRLGASDENGHNGYNGYNGNGYNGNGNRVHPLENGRYDDMDDPDSLV